MRSFVVTNVISSAKSSRIFAGQKHWKSHVDKYRSFNALDHCSQFCILIPCSRHSSETGMPPSAFFKMPMIRVSLNRAVFIKNLLRYLAKKNLLLNTTNFSGNSLWDGKFTCKSANSEYPSWSSGVLSPFSVCFDQCVCELDEFAHDRRNGDLRWFSFCDHVLVFGAHIRVVFGRDESWHVERVAQRFSPALNARFATPFS